MPDYRRTCMLDRPCSLYRVTHRESGKGYVGISVNPKERWQMHVRRAQKGKGSYFGSALLKHGETAFDWEVITEWPTVELAKAAECVAIAAGLGDYNLTQGGDGLKGATESTRAKMSAAKKGRKLPEATRARMSASHRARLARLGITKKVKPKSTWTPGPLTEETKAKISAALTGKPKAPFSAEHRAKLGKYPRKPRGPYGPNKRTTGAIPVAKK